MEQFIAFVIKNWLLWAGFAVVLLLLLLTEFQSRLRGPRRLSNLEATQLINRENAVIFDVRDQNAFSKGHIIGAQHLLPSQVKDKLIQLNKYKAQPIILVCEHGQQSATVGEVLRKNGFERVYSLQGGLTNWRQAGLPLEKK